MAQVIGESGSGGEGWAAEVLAVKRLVQPQLQPEEWRDEGCAALPVPRGPVPGCTPLRRYLAAERNECTHARPAMFLGMADAIYTDKGSGGVNGTTQELISPAWDMAGLSPLALQTNFGPVHVNVKGTDNDGASVSISIDTFVECVAWR